MGTRDVNYLGSVLIWHAQKPWVQSLAPYKLSVVLYTVIPVLGRPVLDEVQLHNRFEVKLHYKRTCLKQINNKKPNKQTEITAITA